MSGAYIAKGALRVTVETLRIVLLVLVVLALCAIPYVLWIMIWPLNFEG